jgi:hypothetical protein
VILIITGSRFWTDKEFIRKVLLEYSPIDMLVHGAANGADSLAAELATEYGWKTDPFPVTAADWKRLGKKAGPLRNRRMLDAYPPAENVVVLAFPLHRSRGTYDCGKEAERRGYYVRWL